VLDLLACDVEREHRRGDAVVLGDQTGLAVDRALEPRQARFPVVRPVTQERRWSK
jgi:hypothetical protein